MNWQLIFTFLFIIGYLSFLFFIEKYYKARNIKSEYTRKFAHVFATISSLSFVLIFHSHWYILIIGIIFFLLLFIGKRKNKFNSIDSVKRDTSGSYLLPIVIYVLFLIYTTFDNSLYYVLPMLILGISDPIAGLSGTYYKSKTKEIKILTYNLNKTYLGSSLFFISTLFVSFFTLYFYNFSLEKIIFLTLILSFVNTIVEMISSKGLDNFTVPIVSFIILYYLG